jgi:hypothetical protein
MSRNEKSDVSSQKKTSCRRLPDRTTPSIDPMNARRSVKNRGTGSDAER